MAKARSIGSIYASLSLRDAAFSKGMAAATKKLQAFGAASLKYGAIAGGAVTAGLIAGTKSALDNVDALGDLSVATGVAIADLLGLQQAYKEGGLSAGKVGADIAKMQKSISDAFDDPDGSAGQVFKRIGLDVASLIKLSPAEQFEKIGKAIDGVGNMAQKVAAARDIFGKSGGSLLSVFDNVEEARASLGKYPEIAEKFANAMGRANDLIGRLPNKSDQFFTGFTGGIIGELLPALEKTNGFDFTDLGQSLGENIAIGIHAISDTRVWDAFTLNGLAAIVETSNALGNYFSSSINALGDEFADAFTPQGNKTLLAAKAFMMDTISLGARDDRRQEVLDKNLKEWQDSQNYQLPDFGERFSKYFEAAKLDETPFADDLRKRAADLTKGFTDEMARNLEAAANLGRTDGIPPGNDPIFSPRDLDKHNPVEAARMEVNDYQRRGLSLDGDSTSSVKIDKQTTILTEIRDGIRRISDRKQSLAF